ncbi:MAG: triphosphoribosyl-dephospho-CoA synthase, partial [Sphaerochaetaceae bacterium]|nr:triphosphoribosyl-dephospho-CoA synthase [Sphaerochaetaceae bacterium]
IFAGIAQLHAEKIVFKENFDSTMSELKSKILSHREERHHKIQFLKKGFKTVITVKANIPGDNKNIKEAYILINLFKKLIPDDFIVEVTLDEGADGPSYIISSNIESTVVKETLKNIEDTHFLGRFIDLDFYGDLHSLNRSKLSKCYLCNEEAFKCIRNATHTIEELNTFIIDKVYIYYQNLIKSFIEESILSELNLHPKFGLVTPITNGSHSDMNYETMLMAKDAIIPFLLKMFKVGWTECIDNVFLKIRSIGQDAEREMFDATKNINAYKGLIFNLGILVSAYGYVVSNNIELSKIFDIVKHISKDVLDDFKKESKTFGYIAYKQYNILGARGEVYKGIPHAKKALNYLKDLKDESRLRTLMYLISDTDDTVLLKRCKSYDKYIEVKRMFKENINSDLSVINDINQKCIDSNLSFGGSADLLILTVFLKKIGL